MRPRQTGLSVLFDRLTTVALAGATSLACGGSTGPRIDPTAFPEALCNPAPYLEVHGLAVSSLDYIALRQTSGPIDPARPFTLVDEDGVACASAKDRAACASALASVQSEKGWLVGTPNFVQYIVTTAGDTVSTITDLATLLAKIGPIDNARKAALLLALNAHQVSCDVTKARATQDGGYDVIVVDYGPACGESYKVVEHVAPDGTVTEVDREQKTPPSKGPCGTGRRPEGLAATGCAFDRDLGAFFAEVAHLEAASVTAFTRLARELAAHGAPGELVRRAEHAARDEVRHARTVSRLARRFGAEPRAPRIAKARRRSLEAIARENAVEGCVRETFGALLATWQSRVAEDRAVRAAMRGIARDETAHAELSWQLARWLEPRLSPAARARVEQARRDAIGDLGRELSRGVAESIQRGAGVPSPRVARTLFEGVRADLWAA